MKKVVRLLRMGMVVALVLSMGVVSFQSASAEGFFGGLGSLITDLIGEKSIEATEEPADFYEAMDSYEAFFDEYVEFMKDFDESSLDDLSVLTDYTSLLSQYADVMEKLDAIDEDELTAEEDAYYIEVMLRINKKLLEIT